MRRPRRPGAVLVSLRQLVQDNAKLRGDNRDLAEHLELAIANIQRLTIDNQALREAREAARNVTRLPTKPPMRS